MPLPYREQLESRLGRSLGHIEAYSGPDARATLDALGADAATVGNKVYFADRSPALSVVAHEVAHTLQAEGVETGEIAGVAGPDSDAELEAQQVARDVAGLPDAAPASPVDVAGQLDAGTVALQRAGAPALDDSGSLAVLERPAEPEPPQPEPQPAAETEAAPAAPAVAGPAGAAGEAAAVEAEEAGLAEFELPPAPEPGVTAEEVQAREAALAEAEAVLAAAQDVPQLMDAFAQAPPTLKAGRQDQLGQDATSLAQQETQQYQENLPDFHARMNGEAEPAQPLAVESPGARDVALEESAPPPAPEPDIPETPDPGHYNANDSVTRVIDQFFNSAEPADRAGQIGDSLNDVSTSDPDIPRSPGPAPTVPLEGETDPQRLANQAAEGVAGARAARDEARQAVLDGPGPEQAQPVQLDEPYAVDALNQPAVRDVAPVEGAQNYLNRGLPPEVQTAFDQQQQQAMQESMTGAVEQASTAATERDQARQSEVEAAETQAADLSQSADEQQRTRITEARETIQSERQATLDAQAGAVAEMETDAETRRQEDRNAIDDRVDTEQETIRENYVDAETDIDDEIQKGEREAEDEKQQAEKEAEDQSWWDRAVSFVRQAFSALVAAINTIFDRVRSAVNKILDEVKALAMQAIDAVAGFIKDAIAVFGEFLKGLVDGLLGDIFPGLAAALNSAINTAVSTAQGFVDTVAEGLKAGVAALIDGLKAGLNRILDMYQAALNVAVGLVEAALTGNWSALARKLLEAVLQVIGVDPESFYAFIGRAEETFQIILDDPVGFLSNVVDGFLGGVRLFATNILTHLQAGIIGWLTGTLGSAGITLPERFDLMGVLSLAQQILGLTWDRLREKAVRLVGEANVARLEFIYSYIETLITEGWSGLWERIQNDLATLRDTVLEGIKSFLVERVIMAAITKIASLFSPVGALVQLVLAAWNLFTFLRDQLQRIFQVVQTVIDAIGDIARGVLEPAMARVEQVLASLLPLALDLLARLLGLGNVGAKVREIIQRVQQTIDQAIDRLIERVLAAFRGGGPSTAPTEQPEPATAPAAAGEESPEVAGVKAAALADVQTRTGGRTFGSIEDYGAILDATFRQFQPQGLKALVATADPTSLAITISAHASIPSTVTITWKDVFHATPVDSDVLNELFTRFEGSSRETYAAVAVNGQLIGSARNAADHAELELIDSDDWQDALDRARSAAEAGQTAELALLINRSPCGERCSPGLARWLRANRGNYPGVRFVLAPSGNYAPVLTVNELREQVGHLLDETGRELSVPLNSLTRAELEAIIGNLVPTGGIRREEATSVDNLRQLQSAGWELHRLQAGTRVTPSGELLARRIEIVRNEAQTELARHGSAGTP